MEFKITHRNLCIKAAKYLRSKGIHPYHKGQYSVCELERIGECPDSFAWGGSSTQLIEAKVSRSDFLSDKKKHWRANPEKGLGRYRSYICPTDLIKPKELPEYWGLLYIDDKGKITEIVKAEQQECNHIEEINLITSILRRENIKPQMFSYKVYKNESEGNINCVINGKSEQQSSDSMLPDALLLVCKHENEKQMQGNGFIYTICADCGEDLE